MRLSAYLDFAVGEILRMDDPRPIQSTDYDTCWAARLTNPDGTLAYPDVFRRLMSRQRPDGSWGGQLPYAHDRIVTTLAVVLLLARLGNRQQDHAQRSDGERYLWQHAGELDREPNRTVGFEMILPTLLSEGRQLGLDLPYAQLRHYEKERARKLGLLPGRQIFETHTSALFSLEAFAGEVDARGVADLLLDDGSMATSPSATAFFLGRAPGWRSRYPRSTAYLDDLIGRYDGLPTIAPSDIFLRAWALYYLHHGNLLDNRAALLRPIHEYLLERWKPEGVGWASVGLPESDDTAMVLLALRRAGYAVDGSSLLAYERDDHFAVLRHERDPSISANLHILEAVGTLPKKDRARARDKILRYVLGARRHGSHWSDKWHASPYYPTGRALMTLSPHVPEEMGATAHWFLATQRDDGGWGQHTPTAEETALALLALLEYHRAVRPLPREPLRRAARYLLATERPFQESYPELWISKALYAPTVVVRSTILAALGLYADTFGDEDGAGR